MYEGVAVNAGRAPHQSEGEDWKFCPEDGFGACLIHVGVYYEDGVEIAPIHANFPGFSDN